MSAMVRSEAADLLSCLANQPGYIWGANALPGDWSDEARRMAWRTFDEVVDNLPGLKWRERYAEAEARLREVRR